MNTEGGETVTLSGLDLSSGLGSASDVVTASCTNAAGATFGPTSCIVTGANAEPATQVVCRTPAGLGTGIRWSVTVNGVSGALSAPLNAYGAPTLGSIRCVLLLHTRRLRRGDAESLHLPVAAWGVPAQA